MHRSLKFAAGATLSAAVAAIAVLPTASSAHRPGDGHGDRDRHAAIRHVLLISVDGLHQSDVDWYVAAPPRLGAREACQRRRRVHQRAHVGSVGL